MATLAEVDSRVAQVNALARDALGRLRGGWWTTDTEEAMALEIERGSMTRERWAEMGREAARKGTTPAGGWDAWLKRGQGLANVIYEAVAVGDAPVLAPFLAEVARAAPKVTRAVGKTLAAGAEAAGGITAAAVRPLLLPVVVLAVLATAVLVALRRFKVL